MVAQATQHRRRPISWVRQRGAGMGLPGWTPAGARRGGLPCSRRWSPVPRASCSRAPPRLRAYGGARPGPGGEGSCRSCSPPGGARGALPGREARVTSPPRAPSVDPGGRRGGGCYEENVELDDAGGVSVRGPLTGRGDRGAGTPHRSGASPLRDCDRAPAHVRRFLEGCERGCASTMGTRGWGRRSGEGRSSRLAGFGSYTSRT